MTRSVPLATILGRCLVAWQFYWLIAGCFAGVCQAGERMALVIANSKYAGDAALRNPSNDADAIEAALKELNFKVVKQKDLDLRQMQKSLVEFQRELPKDGLGWFYYAGHGVQVQGENYLVPIGAQMREEFEVKWECLPAEQVLDAMNGSASRLRVLVLDCCRSNPFKRGWKRAVGDTGLAPIGDVPDGTLIAFSTAPGKSATDGLAQNSPYAGELVAALRSRPDSGLELVDVFRISSRAVKKSTGQVPWLTMEASLEKCYLRPADPTVVPIPATSAPAQTAPAAPTPSKQAFTTPPAMSPSQTASKQVKPGGVITNSIGMKLTLIPAGEFMMGSPNGEPDRNDDENPQHRVRITRPFYLGVYEVTQAEYQQLLGKNPSWTNPKGQGGSRFANFDTSRFPVERVDWEEAARFCHRLSAREGAKYRLPTEAEWEYACRAGTTTAFSFGDTITTDVANFGSSGDQPGALGRTTSVGSYRPNAFGLYDMHGNVSEWCSDRHDEDYYSQSPPDDPLGPTTGSFQVLRGGGYYGGARGCRSALRNYSAPLKSDQEVGFRVAREP